MSTDTILLLVYMFIALFFSFLCSILEAALLSISPGFIETLIHQKKKSGKALANMKRDIEKPLAAILSLNTISHTIGAAGVGAQATLIFGNNYVGVTSGILTLLILVFSEIIPKTLGALYWRNLAGFTAKTIPILVTALFPLVLISVKITSFLSNGNNPHKFDREEFSALAKLGAKDGIIDERESHFFRHIIDFSSLKVKDIMTPRTVLFALQENRTVGDINETLDFSRIPVFQKNIDDITGFVLKSELLEAKANNGASTPLSSLKREIISVLDFIPVTALFELFFEEKQHIALVADEHGGVQGIVTLEDMVETLLGMEIVDEADKVEDMQALARLKMKKRTKDLDNFKD